MMFSFFFGILGIFFCLSLNSLSYRKTKKFILNFCILFLAWTLILFSIRYFIIFDVKSSFIYFTSLCVCYIASIPAILAKSPTLEILQHFFILKKNKVSVNNTFNKDFFLHNLISSGFIKKNKSNNKILLSKKGLMFLLPFIVANKLFKIKDV